eukprot:CAMPEP_0178467330 /NCGR_PEP_ID=MMETSP0689_2-20121128/52357_1 /TAXON_ID=160604 /ORGANISM="Amphidinium massartii, Strain CS-259" /LENGTH=48 /DNA_ID= /DNA_START= /DNA_END= /DNA_ORIENTATION=
MAGEGARGGSLLFAAATTAAAAHAIGPKPNPVIYKVPSAECGYANGRG